MSSCRSRNRAWVLLVVAQSFGCGGATSTDFPEAVAGAGSQCLLEAGGATAVGGKVSNGGKGGNGGVSLASAAGSSSVQATAACGTSPWVLVGKVPNARQLGGVLVENGATVVCDQLYRGSNLSLLTAAGCDEFAARGIKSVIDLRSLGEQSAVPVACVTQQAKVTSAPMPVPYNMSPADYLAILYTATSIRAAFAVLADETAYPVYFHCHYGKDRTGVVAAVILLALGASREAVLSEYALTGEAGFGYYVDSLSAVLDEIERIGGIAAYFETVGVTTEQVAAMRKILMVSANAE